MRIKLYLAHRAPGGFRSIEELFTTIARAFPEWVMVSDHYAPSGRARPQGILSNLRWAAGLRGGDLVHLTGDAHYAILGVRSVPVVLTVHDLRFLEESSGFRKWLFRWLWLEWPCRHAARITVISEFTRERLLQLCRVDSSKVKVIPNCVSAEFQPVPRSWPSRPRMLLVGCTPNKNLERVLRAGSGLAIQWVLLGNLDKAQERMFTDKGVAVERHSGLTREQVVGLYQSCDFLCFVSTYEGFGMPILEAQATGIPVVTSNTSPMSDVAGEGALTVDPLDEESIRTSIERILNENELRQDLVTAGFSNAAKYSSRAVAGQYAELYREVLEER